MKTRTNKLTKSFEIKVQKMEPFNFLFTFWKPSHFFTGLEAHTGKCSWRTFRMKDDLIIGARFKDDNKYIDITIYTNREIDVSEKTSIITRIDNSYGLSEKYDLENNENYPDRVRILLNKFIGTRISCPESFFEMTIISLILQNTTIKRTTSMLSNLLDNYGLIAEFDGKRLKVFFTPSEIRNIQSEEYKEICKLGYRAKSMVEYVRFFNENAESFLRSLSKGMLLQQLQKIKGVGPYTANVIASSVLRGKKEVGLDCWNSKILGDYYYRDANISLEELSKRVNNDFGDNAGMISMYVVEDLYIACSPAPLIDCD